MKQINCAFPCPFLFIYRYFITSFCAYNDFNCDLKTFTVWAFCIKFGNDGLNLKKIKSRDDWIRTSGLFVPNEARYRAALHPENLFYN